jgi:hypothetical protein
MHDAARSGGTFACRIVTCMLPLSDLATLYAVATPYETSMACHIDVATIASSEHRSFSTTGHRVWPE